LIPHGHAPHLDEAMPLDEDDLRTFELRCVTDLTGQSQAPVPVQLGHSCTMHVEHLSYVENLNAGQDTADLRVSFWLVRKRDERYLLLDLLELGIFVDERRIGGHGRSNNPAVCHG
jgi:hypothetical protein